MKTTFSKIKKMLPWPVWVLVIVGAVLRGFHLGAKSLWMDEVRQVSMYFDSENIFHLIHGAAGQQQPALDYAIGWFVALFLPFHEITARLPAFVFGVLVIPLVFVLGRRVADEFAGVLAALLVTFFPPLIEYSQEARPYSIYFVMFLLFTINALNLNQTRESQKRLFWLTLALLMTRGFEPLVAALSFSVVLFFFKLVEGESERAFLKTTALTITKASLCFLPFFALLVGRSKKYLAIDTGHPLKQMDILSLSPILDPLQNAWPKIFTNSFALVVTLLLGAALWILAHRKQTLKSGLLFLLAFFVSTYVLHCYIFYGAVNGHFAGLSSKYLLYLVPLFFVILAAVMSHIKDRVPTAMRSLTQTLLLALTLILCGLFAQEIPTVYAKQKADYRSLGRWIEKTAQYGDVILKESFVSHKKWETEVFGEGLYFKKQIPRLLIEDLTTQVLELPEKTSRILVVMQSLPSDIEFDKQIFEVEKWYDIHALRLKAKATNWREEFKIILSELLKIYPNTDSQVALLIARAKLLCGEDKPLAQADLQKAADFLKSPAPLKHCE